MNVTQAIGLRIEELCLEKGITQNKLCTLCGITQSTINNIMNRNQKDVSLLTIVRICNGLDMTLNDFFDVEIFKKTIEEKI
jgi:transcriptional regulator with XRE-family HTH domain